MSEKHSLLIIGNVSSAITGSRGACEDLADQLEKAGWHVILASSKKNRLRRLTDMLRSVLKFRKEYQVAIIDVFSGWSFIWAELIALTLRLINKQYILVLRGGSLPEFMKSHLFRVHHLLRSADKIVAPSNFLIEEFLHLRSDIVLIPNPIHLDRYFFQSKNKIAPKLVWLRAFHNIYNPELAPKIIKILSHSIPDITLLMIGPDKNDGSLLRTKQLCEDFTLKEHIAFKGPVSKKDVPFWMNKGDIFINTTNIDNTPVTVIEAMACGLCVVSTNVGGIPYLLEDEKDSLLVPPNDPFAMAEAILRLLTEPGLSARLSDNARKNIEEFDWPIVLHKWESLLYQVLDENIN